MPQIVVAVALVDRRGPKAQVLLGRRSRPSALAGYWEFPGGKVEPGERDTDALRRECREELAVEVVLSDRLGTDLVLPNGSVLRVWIGSLPRGWRPAAREHAELRWVGTEDLSGLDWIPADRPLVTELVAVLAG